MSVVHIPDVEAAALAGDPILPERLAEAVKRRRNSSIATANSLFGFYTPIEQSRPPTIPVVPARNGIERVAEKPAQTTQGQHQREPTRSQSVPQRPAPLTIVPGAPVYQQSGCYSPASIIVQHPPVFPVKGPVKNDTSSGSHNSVLSLPTTPHAPNTDAGDDTCTSLQEFFHSIAHDETLSQFFDLGLPLDSIPDHNRDRPPASLNTESGSSNKAEELKLTDAELFLLY